jgi:hypothetical protein
MKRLIAAEVANGAFQTESRIAIPHKFFSM